MRLTRIEIKDFRGFPTAYDFDLGNARHLVIYGENGSGKSSLFRALEEFFNLEGKARPFAAFKNSFSDPALTDGHVTVHFDDGVALAWTHGGNRQTKDVHVAGTAIRTGCIDYRSLLRTSFAQSSDKVNLFHVAVTALLPHFPVSVRGGHTSIGKIWKDVLRSKPPSRHAGYLHLATTAVNDFNAAVAPAIPPLAQKAQELLRAFPGCDFTLDLELHNVELDKIQKDFINKNLILHVSIGGAEISAHHHFLNEARLSAIGLSLFLAGLLVSIPAPVPGAPEYPKLLVLDDVLMGLDMSNRMPVLDILRNHFSDWQIFLFTHDKVWHEIVRLQTQGDPDWCHHELYLGESQGGLHVPVHKPPGYGWNDFINRAKDHLARNDDRAAAVYARAAFESRIKKYCEKNGLWVKYHTDPRMIDGQAFWDAIKRKAREDGSLAGKQGAFNQLEAYRKVVLNPLSHSAAAAITKNEIQGAITSVEALPL